MIIVLQFLITILIPNPFSNSTDIYFQHNKANQDLDVVLEIYSITGTLVKKQFSAKLL